MTESPTTAPRTDSAAAQTDSDAPPYRYNAELAGSIEETWQNNWARLGTFNVPNPVGSLAPADGAAVPEDKLFVQDMFPYPSGEGLHVGHPLGYIATDVYARYFRMNGRNVLHALGFDAFGLPAEQYAVQTGTHPRTRTDANIVNFRRQLAGLVSDTTAAEASRPPMSSSTSGRSGSSCRSTTPGSTPRPTRRGRSPSWSPNSTPVPAFLMTVATGRSCQRGSAPT